MFLCAGEFGIRRERRRREGGIVDTLDEVSCQTALQSLHDCYSLISDLLYYFSLSLFPLSLCVCVCAQVERSVYDLIGNKGRLVSQEQALPLSRAMIQAELPQHRLLFLSVLQVSPCQPEGCLLFHFHVLYRLSSSIFHVCLSFCTTANGECCLSEEVPCFSGTSSFVELDGGEQ